MPRAVTILSTGGTIAMSGDRMAVPALDGAALVAAVPALGVVPDLVVRSVCNLPGSHLDTTDALLIARAALEEAARGRGVVVTHGTDTLEETAYLTDVMYGGDCPVVFTGAIRPASAPGADGPANLADAVALAASVAGCGGGVLVVFAGRVHAARYVRKMDSTAAEPFGSPHGGAIGVVHEGRVNIGTYPVRRPPVVPSHLDLRVPIVPTWLGDDGALIRAAVADHAHGLVVSTLGAGHLGRRALAALRDAVATLPVVATTRPERGAILYETYGFEGKEADIRELAVAAGGLSAQAARMKLLACLGAGLERAAIAEAFLHDDT
ncbi:MAG: L-asparaginase [uncultured Solirubrobacteraceae bacterium]|uniref:asparaginase n=1 Tax=uncultured Solirubrobacteraceae bacterium TaxID=1162706 RepID=A0A6J4SDY7_9ACTN|nr:MAG: L-asparaginase [uncultured Solirubrobacteraceae bacterium]